MKKYISYKGVMLLALTLSGCATGTDPQTINENLSKTPIGVHVEKAPRMPSARFVYLDITLRNNYGQYIGKVNVEVLLYRGDVRIGAANHTFTSINPGEILVQQKRIDTGGRTFDSWSTSYKLLD